MRTFTFSSPDILNSGVVPEGSDIPEYTVETTGGKRCAREVTTLSGAFNASINWSEKCFEIAGESARISGEVLMRGELSRVHKY